ncbi:reverse transcriptase domain-containing protein, partial [Tanacetum coccineum]
KESVKIESLKSSAQHSVNDFIVINIPEDDVDPKQIILDPDDQPTWESANTVAPTPNSAIVQIDVDDNFVINSTHLKMICENKFDGYLRADPHDHIREFLAICKMFRYGETQSEAVKLLIFPFSLSDKAKTWFNKLNEESITSWEQMRKESYSHQSLHDPNDSEKSLAKLNNDVRNDLEDFKRRVHEWSKSQNISLEQTDRTDPPPPPPQAQTEHVDVVFTWSEMSDYSLEIQKGPPPSIIVNNKTEKD